MEDVKLYINGVQVAETSLISIKLPESGVKSEGWNKIMNKTKKYSITGIELSPDAVWYIHTLKLYMETKTKYFFKCDKIKLIIEK